MKQFKNIHQNKRCFIIGTGPSIRDVNLSILKNEFTFSCNWILNHEDLNQINLNYYCAYDNGFIEPEINPEWSQKLSENEETIKIFPSQWQGKVHFHNQVFVNYNSHKQVYTENTFHCNIDEGFYDGATVIINMCIPAAIFMGFSEIILLGVDTNYNLSSDSEKNNSYFYNINQQYTNNNHNLESEQQWIQNTLKSYQLVQEFAETQNISIKNATQKGNLDIFEHVNLKSIIKE